MAKSSLSKLEPHEFGDFTRERVVGILKSRVGIKSQVFAHVAGGLLAGVDAQGTNPGSDLIATALDVLAGNDTAMAHGLLWQAAEHARNARIRVEAIRRTGPIATAERAASLRNWATAGFEPVASFPNDQVDLNCIRQAAINALGEMEKPTTEDIETIMAALTPRPNEPEFSPNVFNAACEAYWSIGDVASLPKLVGLVSERSRGETDASLTALAAKFSAKQLQSHAEELRSAFLEFAGKWPDESAWADRLLTLAERLATPEFLHNWASRYGGDRLEHGRGRVTLKLLEGFKQASEGVAKGLLILAQWPHNLSASGPVIQGLTRCVGAGYGKLVAQSIVSQKHDGHKRLVESGDVFALYDSVDAALTDICEVISATQNQHDQQRMAEAVATGALAAACPEEMPDPGAKTTGGAGRVRSTREDVETLTDRVNLIDRLDPSLNPVVVAGRLLSPPTSSSGAMAVCESWLKEGDAPTQYVMRIIIREAGRANAFGQEAPMLARFEQCVLSSQPQRPSLKEPLAAALASEVVVDGRLNRYAIDLMRRADLSFEKGAEIALNGIQTTDDAQFLLDRLHDEGAIGVLTRGTRFHRDGKEPLTKHVQSTAISLVTELLKQTKNREREDAFSKQLHERFQDLLKVRESAYRACGQLGSFLSIKPLRDRLPKETASSAKKTIEQAITTLRKRLVEEKPQQGLPDAIRQWLGFVADLGNPALLQHVVGYLNPPHADHAVRHSALNAIEHMPGPKSLKIVKKFISDTAPEGQMLAEARHARLVLEERNDVGLFDVLSKFYAAEHEVLDLTTDYAKLFGTLLPNVTKGLERSLELLNDDHWDEFVTRISGLMQSVVKLVFCRRFSLLGIDHTKAEKMTRGPYHNLLNFAGFRNTYGKLRTHCDTIYAYRGESPTAHATHTDGTAKVEATSDDADIVRDEFKLAFAEAVKALR